MNWWRRRRILPPLEHSWHDRFTSSDEHIGFTARVHIIVQTGDTFDAGWRNDEPLELRPGIDQAIAYVRSEVECLLKQWEVMKRSAAQHAVNHHLSSKLPHELDDGALTVAAVALSVADDDAHAAEEMRQARHEEHLDELARRRVAANMRFLRDECFDNPASARLFLMLNTTTRLGVFPDAQQADAVIAEVNQWHPDSLWVQLAGILQPVVRSLSPSQADELVRILSAALRSTGHPEEADAVVDLWSDARRGPEADSTVTPER
ncbi:hypothetical protein [Amycolatopsis sp. cmx-11-12]|uniref:hypothetical protein n=1 Tax=Amycolatopsis sp. cmx-11-12 TaxID=2785795 RepID=UPI0039182BCB